MHPVIGKLIPIVIFASGVVAAILTYQGLLLPLRPVIYIAAISGGVLSLETFLRQGRGRVSHHPSLLVVALVWFFLSVVLLMVSVLLLSLRSLYPIVPNLPYSWIIGLLAAACIALFVVGLVLALGSRRGILAEGCDPWILRFLFRTGRLAWMERLTRRWPSDE